MTESPEDPKLLEERDLDQQRFKTDLWRGNAEISFLHLPLYKIKTPKHNRVVVIETQQFSSRKTKSNS